MYECLQHENQTTLTSRISSWAFLCFGGSCLFCLVCSWGYVSERSDLTLALCKDPCRDNLLDTFGRIELCDPSATRYAGIETAYLMWILLNTCSTSLKGPETDACGACFSLPLTKGLHMQVFGEPKTFRSQFTCLYQESRGDIALC